MVHLEPEDDAAAVNWEGAWRMLTSSEWEELCNRCNCTWEWLRRELPAIYDHAEKERRRSEGDQPRVDQAVPAQTKALGGLMIVRHLTPSSSWLLVRQIKI